ncbi:MAG: hypothetical protein WCY74_03530 [Sphaerochaetaceae bacterium]|jgi:hypothetical protein|nr:hypothetical protein [Sphaerochaetaceae bacterium]MDD3940933.1 hypothetical protein [Sphaerochaetaceae bacterium]MDX9939368.1 hypothetical protein [Sphaerochaetaceae bacterium]
MNGDTLIAVVAIAAPFLFAAWVIKTGIKAKDRKRGVRDQKEQDLRQSDRELEDGIMDLVKRIENLEIILRNRNHHKE